MSTELTEKKTWFQHKKLGCYEIKREKNFHFNEAGEKDVSKFKII